MDFSITEDQEAIRDLAAQIFEGQSTVDRIREVERSEDRIDRVLWSKLAEANLLGIPLPEEEGGTGYGIFELCLLLEQQGRRVAPVPLLPTLAAAMTLAEFGTAEQKAALLPGVISGDVVLTAALAGNGVNDPFRTSVSATPEGILTGSKPAVPVAHLATRVLVPAAAVSDGSISLYLVDPGGVGVTRTDAFTTNREIHSHLTFDGAPGDALGGGDGALRFLVQRWLVGLAAIQVGVTQEATRAAAEYTSNRVQFGKPLSSFQGVALKAADCYIDTEAIRVTMQNAAWRIASGLDATAEVEVAKWWAADAGQRVVHTVQYLHGGMGADIEYPVHRYFLWGKQIEDCLGGASAHLAALGKILAAR